MQFKNPKTGEVFEDILTARKRFCPTGGTCMDCAISGWNNGKKMPCHHFCDAYPAEAARRMGYTVEMEAADTPLLTNHEIDIMQTMGAKWASRGKGEDAEYVELWDTKPKQRSVLWGRMKPLAKVAQTLFPSIRPGDRVCVDDQTGKGA